MVSFSTFPHAFDPTGTAHLLLKQGYIIVDMGMAQARTRVPKMVSYHIRIPTQLGIGACHKFGAMRDNPGPLATLTHLCLLHTHLCALCSS